MLPSPFPKFLHRNRRWLWLLLGALTLLLSLTFPGIAQVPLATQTVKAPVVVDGVELFQIGRSGNLTAVERAEIINEALRQEVRSAEPTDIRVERDDKLTIIRSEASNRNLITVTDGDVTTGINPLSQATLWRSDIEAALRRGQLERSPAYFRQAAIFSAVVLVVAIAFHLGLRFLGKWLSHRLSDWLGDPDALFHPRERSARLFLQLALLGIQIGLWSAVAFYVTDLFPEMRGLRYSLLNFLNTPIVGLGEGNYSALQLLLLLALTVGLWFAVSAVTRLFRFYILSRTGAELRIQDVIAILTQYTLAFLGLIVLLQIWGLDVSSLAIIASVLGVGIGFGIQNITNNFISGLIITLERPIQVGDFVKVAELMGTVERIGARSTEIRTLDQVTIIVPNSRFLETEVVNWSHGDPVSRIRIPVGIAYDSDTNRVQAALLEAARSHPDVLVRPAPEVWFQGLGDSALNFELMVWTGEPKKQFRVKSDLYYRIETSLRRYGITVPFPQRDLHLRSPHLEEFVALWRQLPAANAKNSPQLSNGDTDKPTLSLIGSATNTAEASERSATIAPAELLTDEKIQAIATAIQGSAGVEVSDRWYRQNLYPACFIGSEAVAWLVQTQNCTREEAIHLGQILLDQGIIQHVSDDYPFRDGYVFYRFQSKQDEM
ncbi:mechanosensitive ion channel [Leptolyngbya sp. FACHB-541]|uniref:mechanosensitive ion channel domain-containing protein n=1 Tax=Leptolyngbya sp. FACHB-541 TaxID=2692810 RepID=UPI0016841064|nr:mechanosensitive ion channel domain-containing protein [Leptolyngbya sp. FACHB-541]MBD1999572.1 mechanosensitive ion channel [Leptolyngbya sp. FACHB-541]